MRIMETIKERLVAGLLTALLGALGYILASLYHDVADPLAKHVVPAIGGTNLLWLSLLLLLSNLVAWVSIVWLMFGNKVERLKRRYEFVEERGFYEHRESGKRICSNCLLKGIESPLGPAVEYGQPVLRCVNKECCQTYREE